MPKARYSERASSTKPACFKIPSCIPFLTLFLYAWELQYTCHSDD